MTATDPTGIVLVPIDGSEPSMRALRHAIARVRGRAGASLHVLTVVTPPLVYGEVEVYVGVERAAAQVAAHAAGVLDVARAELAAAPEVRYVAESVSGTPIDEVVARRAREIACSEIVIGTRGQGRLATAVLGSVAAGVVRLVEVPVTLVK
jgi:nucleotide-binding universal stress UspA family protein